MADEMLQELFTRYQDGGSLLSILKEVQSEYGYVSGEAMNEIAERLDISVADVYAVGTFYSFISTEPLGKNIVRICNSVPCYMKNNQAVIEAVEKALGIKAAETTPDGKFSIQLANCIGACDKAPAMMINDETYTDLTPNKIQEIVDSYK
jgi:NADH-quinone oxidoreductase E subunit